MRPDDGDEDGIDSTEKATLERGGHKVDDLFGCLKRPPVATSTEEMYEVLLITAADDDERTQRVGHGGR